MVLSKAELRQMFEEKIIREIPANYLKLALEDVLDKNFVLNYDDFSNGKLKSLSTNNKDENVLSNLYELLKDKLNNS